MKLVIGISRWTNASRSHAVHIADNDGRPLCGGKRQKRVFSWSEVNADNPTCKACIRRYEASPVVYDEPVKVEQQATEISPQWAKFLGL